MYIVIESVGNDVVYTYACVCVHCPAYSRISLLAKLTLPSRSNDVCVHFGVVRILLFHIYTLKIEIGVPSVRAYAIHVRCTTSDVACTDTHTHV